MSDNKFNDMNTEVFNKKTIMALIFWINDSDIYMEKAWIKQDIIVLLQIFLLRSKIKYFRTVIFPKVQGFIDIIFKDECFLILYYNWWQLCFYNSYLNL